MPPRIDPNVPAARHTMLLKDKDVKRWFDTIALGSKATAKNYLRMIGLFLEETKLTPKSFLKLSGRTQAEVLQDYVLRGRDNLGARAGSSVVKKAVVSWLKHMGKLTPAVRDVSVKGAHRTRSHQRLPTKDDLRRVFNVCDPKTRVAFCLVALAGQRIEVVGNLEGDDGLKFRDLPEARFDEKGQLIFDENPTVVHVRPELSKNGQPFFTFLPAEACEYLKAYVADRVSEGEKVTKDSAVFALDPKQRTRYKKEHMSATNIGDRMRVAMRAVGLTQRPYVFRKYFSQNSTRAVAEGLVPTWIEYWMGHDTGVPGVYNLADAEQLIPEMRLWFDRTSKYLQTTVREPKATVKDALNTLLESAPTLEREGQDEQEIEAIKKHFVPVVQSLVAQQRTNGSLADEIQKLGNLFREGLIDADEFKAAKARLLRTD